MKVLLMHAVYKLCKSQFYIGVTKHVYQNCVSYLDTEEWYID